MVVQSPPNVKELTGRQKFMKHWFAMEAIPIYAIIGCVVVGCPWYLSRLARGSSVIWTKDNPTPWNDIKQDENTKLINVNNKLERDWSRSRL